MTSRPESIQRAVREHVERQFPNRPKEAFVWELGPLPREMPDFRVLRIAPGATSAPWIYVTLGSWSATHDEGHGHEFVLHSPVEEPLHVELLAQLTHYNADPEHRLGVGHSVPIGRPWLDESRADHVLLAPAHPYPREFEYLDVDDFKVHFLWVLPVTKAEAAFSHDYGFAALEDRLESTQVDLTDPGRSSLV